MSYSFLVLLSGLFCKVKMLNCVVSGVIAGKMFNCVVSGVIASKIFNCVVSGVIAGKPTSNDAPRYDSDSDVKILSDDQAYEQVSLIHKRILRFRTEKYMYVQ